MSNVVLQLEEHTIGTLMEHYAPHAIERNAPGVRACYKVNGTTITVYHSKKVLFQGKEATTLASTFHAGVDEPLSESARQNEKRTSDTLPPRLAHLSVIGSDETGTGDYFGPMTVAACFVTAQQVGWVRELGVKDSKLLTDDEMRHMAPLLRKTLLHSVLVLPNEKYNTLQQDGMNQGKMKAMMHNQAILHVIRAMRNPTYDYILIDQFAEPATYFRYLQDVQEIVEERVLFATRAEQIHVSVAAASILARVAFLEEMDRLSEAVGITIPKGANAKVDDVAARIWKLQGEDTLRKMTKWHFANTMKAKKKLT